MLDLGFTVEAPAACKLSPHLCLMVPGAQLGLILDLYIQYRNTMHQHEREKPAKQVSRRFCVVPKIYRLEELEEQSTPT